MKVFRKLADIQTNRDSVLTVGTFDGFHLGHQSILEELKAVKQQKPHLLTTIVTFDPHPKKIVGPPGADVKILTTTVEKLQIFEAAAIDQVALIPFTKAFAAQSSEEFVRRVMVDKLRAAEVVIGYDHHFGRNREGSFEKLRALGEKWGFTVDQVAPLEKDGQLISSTHIRRLLEKGAVERAATFLGRPYTIRGTVRPGNGRGRELGFPTANIEVDDPDKLVPATGVYAVEVRFKEQTHQGMMNIGYRPTFDFDYLTLEVHLFNFNDLLYDERLEVRFKRYIREEKKFSDPQKLRSQLEKDKLACENI